MIFRIVLLLLCFLSVQLTAGFGSTSPEKVFPLSQQIKPLSYYQEQASAWQKITKEQPDVPEAWLNFYTAARNSNLLSSVEAFDLQKIVEQMALHIPASFEYYYLAFWHSPISNRRFDYLIKAHQIDPLRTEAYHDMLTYYEIEGREDEVLEYCQKMYQANIISSGILNWNYNALMSVEAESILLVQGDNDTYPALLLQKVHGIQPRVKVLNVHLLQFFEAYRNRVFKAMNIPNLGDGELAGKEVLEIQHTIIQHLIKYSTVPIYLGIALTEEVRQQFEEQLYLTGLAFLHFKGEIDNIAILRNNYEFKFRKEDLIQPLNIDKSQSVINHINMNYIPLLAMLHRHYLTGGEQQKAKQVRALGLSIAERNEKKDLVAPYFQAPGPTLAFESLIDFKTIEKEMLQVDANLYASAVETSNIQYEQFLMDLLQQKQFDLLEKCKIYPTDWLSLIPAEYQDQDESVYFQNGHPEEDNMPIVNITYEAAKLYCEWLTQSYNQSDRKRKRFGKVQFFLPSEEEWKLAARAGRKFAKYPWGGAYIQNNKNCYLANLNPYKPKLKQAPNAPEKEPPGTDGAYFTAAIDSYFPNDFGLYNMSGNVAEMVREGFTKGGSWLEAAKYLDIDEKHEQELPSPAVGFRVFMKILD